jgi:hypothetical protein
VGHAGLSMVLEGLRWQTGAFADVERHSPCGLLRYRHWRVCTIWCQRVLGLIGGIVWDVRHCGRLWHRGRWWRVNSLSRKALVSVLVVVSDRYTTDSEYGSLDVSRVMSMCSPDSMREAAWIALSCLYSACSSAPWGMPGTARERSIVGVRCSWSACDTGAAVYCTAAHVVPPVRLRGSHVYGPGVLVRLNPTRARLNGSAQASPLV